MCAYRILAIGDSIVWGQGLKAGDKFVNQVARSLETDTDVGNVEVTLLAHSGAAIKTKDEGAWYLYGEIPETTPNILAQLEISKGRELRFLEKLGCERINSRRECEFKEQIWHKNQLKERLEHGDYSPNLVIVDGGINDEINDEGLLWMLFDPRDGGRDVEELIQKIVDERLKPLLKGILREHRQSRVVVTGYFPIFTSGSRMGEVNVAAILMSLPGVRAAVAVQIAATAGAAAGIYAYLLAAIAALKGAYKIFAVRRSELFCEEWTKRVRSLVKELRQEHGKRIYFVKPEFGELNGILASDSYLFAYEEAEDLLGRAQAEEILGLSAADPEAKDRFKAYQAAVNAEVDGERILEFEKPLDEIVYLLASVGHPNEAGARAYARAIIKCMKNHADSFGVQFGPDRWSDSVQLEKPTSERPALAVLGDDIHMAWKAAHNNDLLVASSRNAQSWSNSVRLDKQSPLGPALAPYAGRLWMAWKSNDSNDLFIASAKDGFWTRSTRLDKQSMASPALAAFDGKLFMAWKPDDGSGLCVASFHKGEWSSITPLDKQSPMSPALTVLGGTLYMAWRSRHDDELYVASSEDGRRWSDSKGSGKDSPLAPALAAHKGRLYMAWKAMEDDNDICWASSKDGVSWSVSERLGKQSPLGPALASIGDRLVLAWKSNHNDNLFVSFMIA